MGKTQRNFVLGRMNKSLDERLVPNGEYVDALNIRLGSTEASEVGSVENSAGNTQLTSLFFPDSATLLNINLSTQARTIGAFEDGANETLYWFVHDPAFTLGDTGKCDMIVSFNTVTALINYHVISIDNGGGISTTLNFNPENLITGVNLVSNLLFFTDNLNPPRFINVNSNYPNPLVNGSPVNPSFPTAPVRLAWSFTAQTISLFSKTQIGFHQATTKGCPVNLEKIGIGETPTTTQIPLPGTDCYTSSNTNYTKGFGIQGVNASSTLALTQFSTEVSTGITTFSLMNSNAVGNPGASGVSGTIVGNNGTSGTWSGSYVVGTSYADGNFDPQQPESTGPVALLGLTLTNNVTYTLYL